MAIDRGSETTVQLLTLLNVSATRAPKRKWIEEERTSSRQKLNKRKVVRVGETTVTSLETVEVSSEEIAVETVSEAENGLSVEAENEVVEDEGPASLGTCYCAPYFCENM